MLRWQTKVMAVLLLMVMVMMGWASRLTKDTMNCPEKVMKISHFNQNQSAHSIYIKIEVYNFSLDQ